MFYGVLNFRYLLCVFWEANLYCKFWNYSLEFKTLKEKTLYFYLQGAVGTNITVKTLCDIMCDDSRGDTINRYADVNSHLLSTYAEKCLDASYKGMIDDLTKTDWNSSASEGGKP